MNTVKLYYVFDTLTNLTDKTMLSKRAARRRAERLNQGYGCVRYVARLDPENWGVITVDF